MVRETRATTASNAPRAELRGAAVRSHARDGDEVRARDRRARAQSHQTWSRAEPLESPPFPLAPSPLRREGEEGPRERSLLATSQARINPHRPRCGAVDELWDGDVVALQLGQAERI